MILRNKESNMFNFDFLATVHSQASSKDIIDIALIWKQIVSIEWFHAVLAISFGVVYLLYGWRIFKALAVICFAMIGLFLGMYAGKEIGSEMWGGVVGLVLMAALAFPLMKYCICLLGAAAGGILTGAVWYAFDLPPDLIWAGALVGVVAGGMISFIVFKVAIMLFTSLGGSAITSIGILSLFYRYEQMQTPVGTFVYDQVHTNSWFLPVVLLVPTIIGIFAQNKLIKHSPKWEI
jgi:hypothetical protein